jgi:hypothetical protein
MCVQNYNVVMVSTMNSLLSQVHLFFEYIYIYIYIYIRVYIYIYIIFIIPRQPNMPGPPHYPGFPITFRHTTFGRNTHTHTPGEWPARPRDLYLTIHNTQNRHPSMPPAEFESAIPTSQLPQTQRPLAHCDRLNILLDNQNSSCENQKNW